MTGPESNVDRMHSERPALFLMTNSFETGGSERQFLVLANSLAPAAFNVSVGCISKRGAFLRELGQEVREFPLGGNLYGVRSWHRRWQLAQYLRRSRTAIAQAFDFYTNLTLIPAARLARVPVVVGSQRQLGDLLSPAKRRAELAVLRWCDCIVCNSQAAADRLLNAGFARNQIAVIGNGFPAETFAKTPPAFPRNSPLLRVGMIARMNTASKNHSGFLRTAARIAQRFPQTEFMLAGDGPLRKDLEREATGLGIENRVRFLGDRSDIPAILASLDVTVLPSLSESLSNSILESMAAGVPVVATRVGGNSELVSGDRGILVSAGDDDALAGAIERLLSDATMRGQLGRNARQFAESQFSIASVQRQYGDLYRELLEKKAWRPRFNAEHAGRDTQSDRPVRIAIVAASSRYVGGQSVQAESLLKNWKNDPEVEASFIPIDPALPFGLRWVESVPVLRTLVRGPFYLAALWRGLKSRDIAHIFSASYWSFLLAPLPAWVIARARGCKAIIHYHSGEAGDHLQQSRIARRILAAADELVVPSSFLVDVFRDYGLTAQAVPNIVDLEHFHFRVRKRLQPRLLCTRGFHPYYRVDLVVRAFAEIRKEFPEAQLTLAGAGKSEAEVREVVKQLELANVTFTGPVPSERIAQFYDAADIFVNASSLDNMPVSILEAFASGTPVVSTAPEGMRCLLEHERTGLLCEPGDVQALAGNVKRLLRDADLAFQIATQAYEQSKQYRWSEVRGQWLGIYRSVANNRCIQPRTSMGKGTAFSRETGRWRASAKQRSSSTSSHKTA